MYPSSRAATFSFERSGMSFWIGPIARSEKDMLMLESSFLRESTILSVSALMESSLGESLTDRLKSTGNWVRLAWLPRFRSCRGRRWSCAPRSRRTRSPPRARSRSLFATTLRFSTRMCMMCSSNSSFLPDCSRSRSLESLYLLVLQHNAPIRTYKKNFNL